jgi:L-fuconate dehydratase
MFLSHREESRLASIVIRQIEARDLRFPLPPGAGSDAVHTDPEYAFAVAHLSTDGELSGSGLTFSLGAGNDLICQAIRELGGSLQGFEIEDLMANFGAHFRRLAEHPQLRWVGPHKGVTHQALASITNGCFDLWAKARNVPLWKLLLDLSPEEVVRLLDLSYVEDVLTCDQALEILAAEQPNRAARMPVLAAGYPAYDTSVGWFGYDDDRVRREVQRATQQGFRAFKLKVGATDGQRDVRRANLLREILGDEGKLMLDVNQQWTLPRAIAMCERLRSVAPYWIEEPTHPDDVLAHQTLRERADWLRIAVGECVPNRIVFKNYMQAGAAQFIQADCTRLGGVSEFLTVSLLARKMGLPVVPHVGDMGQIHQHLVFFNHIALGHERLFLEHIPHLRSHFLRPAEVSDGLYHPPQDPGSSSELRQ